MKSFYLKLMYLSFIFILILPFSNQANAAFELEFSLKPVFENHQINDSDAHYNLKVKKGEKINLSFIVENKTEKDIVVYLQGANGLTSIYGNTQYLNNKGNRYAKFLDPHYEFRKYIEMPESVSLKGKEKKTVSFSINVPDEDLGAILGGIIASTHSPNKQKSDKEDNFQVSNRPEFNLAVEINFDDSRNLMEEVNIKSAESEIISGRPIIFLNIQNDSTKILNNFEGTYEIYEKMGKEKVTKLFEGKMGPFKMAPKTEIFMPIAWQSQEFKSGDFYIIVNAKYFGKKLTYSEPFKIDDKTVIEYSKQIEDTKPLPVIDDENANWFSKIMNNQYIIFILGMLVVLFIGIILGRRTKKRRKRNK